MWPHVYRRIAAVLIVSSLLVAQARKPCFVKVVDAQGAPLADAEVHVFWRHGPRTPGSDDVLRLRTDLRGRCQPRIVVGRMYSCFAIGPDADGKRLVTDTATRLTAGSVVELRAAFDWRPREVQVRREAGEVLTDDMELVFCPSPVPAMAVRLELRDGVAQLPPGPWGDTWVATRSGAGQLLEVCTVRSWDEAPRIRLRRPRVLPVRAVDEQGRDLADAFVHGPVAGLGPTGLVMRRWTPARSCLAVAGGQRPAQDLRSGLPQVALYGDREVHDWIAVGAPGRSPRLLSIEAVRSGKPVRHLLTGRKVELAEADMWSVKLAGVAMRDVIDANVQLVVGADARLGMRPVDMFVPMAVDHGTLRAALPPNVVTSQLVARLTPKTVANRPRSLALPLASGKPGFDRVDVDRLRAIELTVTGPDGSLACATEIAVMPLPDTRRDPESGQICLYSVSDLTGRADFVLGDGAWAIYATDGRAQGLLLLEANALGGAKTLSMAAVPTMRLRVVDATGRGVANARLESFRRNRRAGRGRPNNDRHWARLAFSWFGAAHMVANARSDADGELVVPVSDWVFGHGTYRVHAGARWSDELGVVTDGHIGDVIVR